MEDDGLTLEKATALAIQRESAMMDSKLIHTYPATSAPGMQQAPQLLTAHIQGLQTNRQPQLHPHPAHVPRTKPCQACGRQHGVKAQCPARGKQCSACFKINHFAQVCRSSKKRTSSIHQVDEPSAYDVERQHTVHHRRQNAFLSSARGQLQGL